MSYRMTLPPSMREAWVLRELAVDTTSLIIWPIAEWKKSSFVRALHTTSESPSNTDCWMPNSTMHRVVLCVASTSNTSTEEGRGIFSIRVCLDTAYCLKLKTENNVAN